MENGFPRDVPIFTLTISYKILQICLTLCLPVRTSGQSLVVLSSWKKGADRKGSPTQAFQVFSKASSSGVSFSKQAASLWVDQHGVSMIVLQKLGGSWSENALCYLQNCQPKLALTALPSRSIRGGLWFHVESSLLSKEDEGVQTKISCSDWLRRENPGS